MKSASARALDEYCIVGVRVGGLTRMAVSAAVSAMVRHIILTLHAERRMSVSFLVRVGGSVGMTSTLPEVTDRHASQGRFGHQL